MCAATNRVKVTKESQVLFTVPSGADWSGMTLDMVEDKDLVLVVTSKSYDRQSVSRRPKEKA